MGKKTKLKIKDLVYLFVVVTLAKGVKTFLED